MPENGHIGQLVNIMILFHNRGGRKMGFSAEYSFLTGVLYGFQERAQRSREFRLKDA